MPNLTLFNNLFFGQPDTTMRKAAERLPGNISQSRRAFVNLTLLGLLTGSAYEIGTRGEHWPFSSYPMFSKTRREARVVHYALQAVPQDGSAAFPLYKSKHIHPFLWYRQRAAFKQMLEKGKGIAAVEKGLADTMERYEHGRQIGRHDGPPLRSLRLYRVDWSIDPYAADLIKHEKRAFVAEVFAEDKEPT